MGGRGINDEDQFVLRPRPRIVTARRVPVRIFVGMAPSRWQRDARRAACVHALGRDRTKVLHIAPEINYGVFGGRRRARRAACRAGIGALDCNAVKANGTPCRSRSGARIETTKRLSPQRSCDRHLERCRHGPGLTPGAFALLARRHSLAPCNAAREEPAQPGAEGRQPMLEDLPADLRTVEGLSGREEPLALGQGPAGEASRLVSPECEPFQVAHQVRPAKLTPRARLVRAPAGCRAATAAVPIAGHHARVPAPDKSLEVAPAQPETADQQGAQRNQPGPERAQRHLGRRLRPADLAARGARESDGPVLGDLGPDRRELDHLVHAGPADLGGVLESAAAVAAGVGTVDDHVIDPLGRQ